MNTELKWVEVDISFNPAGIYLVKVNNENTKKVNNKGTRPTSATSL